VNMFRLALITMVTAIATATAQPLPPPSDAAAHAKALYVDGKRYYDTGDYSHAIESWKSAYVASAAPMLLFNIAQAYRLSGDCPMALKIYASYEREAVTISNRDELAVAKSRCVREPTATNPPPESIPPPESVVPPTVVAVAPIAGPGGADVVDLDGPALPMPRAIEGAAARRARNLRWAGIGTGAVGVALLATSLIYGIRANDRAAQVEAARGEWTAAEQSLERAGKSAHTTSVVTALLGGVALIGAGSLYYVGRTSEPRPALTISVSRYHAEVLWRAAF
jgi:tetratricopeptide (TPR) repeat protein